MMCYCPWTFAIAAVMFGATAAAANGRLRWYAVVFVATSVATSIGFAKRDAEFKERARANALEAIKKYEERQKGNSIQPDDPVISH
jgi:hypothetical protein